MFHDLKLTFIKSQTVISQNFFVRTNAMPQNMPGTKACVLKVIALLIGSALKSYNHRTKKSNQLMSNVRYKEGRNMTFA